ncbi:hypothetical protein F4779DRAFT_623673 [Xylariaceae sp. FL0662B]|nr:hypothetical protein F4779DRAFT_623673 [Xylariaceae sp. FL0662B]
MYKPSLYLKQTARPSPTESQGVWTFLITDTTTQNLGATAAPTLPHHGLEHLVLVGQNKSKSEPVLQEIWAIDAIISPTFVAYDLQGEMLTLLSNHVGHFLLNNRILSKIFAAGLGALIVNVVMNHVHPPASRVGT